MDSDQTQTVTMPEAVEALGQILEHLDFRTGGVNELFLVATRAADVALKCAAEMRKSSVKREVVEGILSKLTNVAASAMFGRFDPDSSTREES